MKDFLNLVLTIISAFWFISLGFLAYSFAMLIIALDWRQFILSIVVLATLSLTAIVVAGLAHS